MKTCKGCEKYLDWNHFIFDMTMKDGFTNYCRKCINKKNKERRREQRANQPKKSRKPYTRFFYGSRIPLPPNPKHAIKIEQEPVKVVFD